MPVRLKLEVQGMTCDDGARHGERAPRSVPGGCFPPMSPTGPPGKRKACGWRPDLSRGMWPG